MKRPTIHLCSAIAGLCCLLAAPLTAQTQIGGGTCSSSTLNGTYAVSLTGRQVTSSGNFTTVFQANGTVTFDGLSKVTGAITVDTIASVALPLSGTGSYSVQSNCAGAVTGNTLGVVATFNLVVYNSGTDFLITGTDGTYSYSGSGNKQPTTCSTSTFLGVYTFNGTGYSLSGGAVNGVANAAGLLQFDGQGNLTVNITTFQGGKGPAPGTLTGSYSLSTTCVGSANLTDSSKNAYVMSFSVYSASNGFAQDLYATLAQSSKFLLSGGAHAIFGQPAVNPAGTNPPLTSGPDAARRGE